MGYRTKKLSTSFAPIRLPDRRKRMSAKQKRLPDGQPLATRAFQPERLPFPPGIASPIAAAFMLAELDARARTPVVLVNHDPGLRRIGQALVGMPAHVA